MGLVRTPGGKCIMEIKDGLPSFVKAIDLVEAVYLDIDTMEQSFPTVMMSTANPLIWG